jgi:hypothetical protein
VPTVNSIRLALRRESEVIRRSHLTPPPPNISEACDADRLRDPTPNDNLGRSIAVHIPRKSPALAPCDHALVPPTPPIRGAPATKGIIEADCQMVALRSAGLTARSYHAEIDSYASRPLEEQLGIRPGVREVGHGIVADFDFSIAIGREIWRAP